MTNGRMLLKAFCRVPCTSSASAAQLARAKTPEDRAKVDLKLHFMARTLDEPVRPFAQHPSCQHYALETASSWNRLAHSQWQADLQSYRTF